MKSFQILKKTKKYAHLAPVVQGAHIEELFKSPAGRLVCKQLREFLFDRIHLNTHTVHTCMHAYANACTVCPCTGGERYDRSTGKRNKKNPCHGKNENKREKAQKREILPSKLTNMGPPPPAGGAPSSPSPLTVGGR